MEEKRTAYVSLETEADKIRRKNLYLATAFSGFVWMLFHFTVIYFFTLELKSPLLVGIFLGVGNLIALLIDVPVSILGRYFPSKKLYLFGALSMLSAGLIFMKFIYASSLFIPDSGSGITTLLGQFVNNASNIILLLVAAGFYGFTKEINDITTLSYILNNSDPSEYASIISKNNIHNGGGALLGLISSGFILTLNTTMAVIVLNVFIVLLILFVFTYFDSSERTISIGDVSKLKVIAERTNIEKMKEYAIGYMAKTDFAKLAGEAKLVFLRPRQMLSESDFDPKILVPETKKVLLSIRKIVGEAPFHFGLLWYVGIILIFGFWDTFAASFLIDYLSNLPGVGKLAYLILGIIAIPAFVTQEFFGNLTKRLGVFPVAIFGIFISGISVILFGLSDSFLVVIVCGICNSLGYAAGMGVGQAGFLRLYNTESARKQNLDEIDSNASAAPMKIIQNLANVLGLTLGGLLLAVFGYIGFFLFFGALLLSVGVLSFVKRSFIAL